MATSGTITQTVEFGNYHLTLTRTSVDVANNCDYWQASLSFYLEPYGSIVSSATKYITINVDGNEYKGTYVFGTVNAPSTGLTRAIKSVTGIKVPHNADGKKSFYVAFSVDCMITYSGVYIGNVTKSGTIVADTIARATTPTLSASSINLGDTLTINTPRASSSFTHKLYYTLGTTTKKQIVTGVGTSYAFLTTTAMCSSLPNDVKGTMTITCETYNGTTLIGTKTVTCTANVPTSIVPSVSSISISEGVTGLATQFGAYIESKSKLKVTVNASGNQGSTIKSYLTTILNVNYTEKTFTSGLLNSSGTITITSKVTDSRGRTATGTTTITVIDYFAPQIKLFKVERCNSDGTLNDNGLYALVTYSINISPCGNKNTKSVKIEWLNGSTWTSLVNRTDIYAVNNATYKSTITYSDTLSFNFRITVGDYFGSGSLPFTLQTAFDLINYNPSGHGIAFGGISTKDAFQEYMDAYFYKEVYLANGEKPMQFVRDLGANENLNNITETGYYHQNANANTSTSLNYPVARAGILTVIKRNMIYQTYQTYNGGEFYYRNYYSSSWNEWKRVANFVSTTSDNVENAINLKNPFIQTTTGERLDLKNASGTLKGSIGHDGKETFVIKNIANDWMSLMTKSGTALTVSRTDGIYPGGDGWTNCGAPNVRWNAIMAKNGTIQTSDREKKKNISSLNDKYVALFNGLKPVSYEFTDKRSDRTHLGFISQDVKETMDKVGLSDLDFAGYCRDIKQEWNTETEKFEDVLDENGNQQYIYSLRYSEFISLNTRMIQECMKKIEEQEKIINELVEMVNSMR